MDELERLEGLLVGDALGPKLVVIVGTAGAGKTSLAVRLAHRVRAAFPDGQLFVNLRGYDAGPPLAPAAALERFLRALGVAPASIPTDLDERAELYRSLTADRRILIILDNAATVGQVRPLLPGDSGALVVVTSRSRLSGLSGRDGAHRLHLGLLTDAEAVVLVAAATADYRGPDDPQHIAELARLCARLPLALRIAAERAAARPLMPLSELIADLRGQSTLWDALSSEDDVEADAVRSVFSWSYRALPPAAARVFRLLGLHPGPDFGVEAAAALVGEEPERIRSLLDALTGAHLLEQTGPGRFQFHDLLRAYALTQVDHEEDVDQQHQALARVAAWYLHSADLAARGGQDHYPSVLAERADLATLLPMFSDQASASKWYSAEAANLVALARAAEAAGLDDVVWQLSATLYFLHETHFAIDDWIQIGQLGLQAADRLGDRTAQATVAHTLAVGYIQARRFDEAFDCHYQAAQMFTELGEPGQALKSVNGMGVVHLRRRELHEAATRFTQTADLARQSGDQVWHAVALGNLAGTSAEAGELQQAVQLAEQALSLYERPGTALSLDVRLTLARAHREEGRLQLASSLLDQARQTIADGAIHRSIENALLLEQSALAYANGDYELALETYWRSARIAAAVGDRSCEARSYDGTGQALRALGRPGEAVDFHIQAAAIHRRLNDPWHLALTLSNLADAVVDLGRMQEADASRAEARSLIEGFVDPRAAQLRNRLDGIEDPP